MLPPKKRNLVPADVFINNKEKAATVRRAAPLVETDDEARWVERARQGDSEAFGRLVDRYHRRVYGIVYRMCGPDDAEDLTQEIFLKALAALRSFQFQGNASFRTWLYRIAVNASINELRRRKRRHAVEGPSLDSPVATDEGLVERDLADEYEPAPAEEVERNETQRAVRQVLLRMRPQHRLVLTLIDLEGMEYRDAANILKCPLGTLKSRVARAREAFGREYAKYQREEALEAEHRRESQAGPRRREQRG
jgi:RNA polymerase sigma-70 factor (ECF subfamily)